MVPEQMLRQKVEQYSTLYIDMDSFFASVEQFYNPKLRGRPVGVATGSSMGASIVAASYDAKAFGIKTGTRVGEAYKLCPSITIINDSPFYYRQVHREFMSLLHDTIGQVQAKGIDEAYIKIPKYARNYDSVYALGKAIKASLYKKYNEYICCSIGIGPNIWVAKMAASSQKPNGLVCWKEKELLEFYKITEIAKMTGIGRRLTPKLNKLGIVSIYDFYSLRLGYLRRIFGVEGEKWYLRLRGFEIDEAVYSPNKSIGHQITTVPDTPDTTAKITTVCNKIAETLGRRLRSKELKARSIYMFLLFEDKTSWQRQLKHLSPYDSNFKIIEYIKVLLKKPVIYKPIVKVSITLGELTSVDQIEMDLFHNSSKAERLSRAIDIITSKYGVSSAMTLSAFTATRVELNRIGFAGDIMRETSIDPTIKPFNWQ